MAFYRPLSFLVLIVMTAASIFFFIQDDDVFGRQLAFFAIYTFIAVFYILKSLYYRRHRATFNELFFVVGLPIFPPVFVILGQYTNVNDLYFSDMLSASIVFQGQLIEFSLAFSSILSLPYLFFSMYLLLRTFIRYEFIRWQAHSTGGPPGTFIGIILAGLVGFSYLIVSLLFGDILLALFGFMYALNGILGFLA